MFQSQSSYAYIDIKYLRLSKKKRNDIQIDAQTNFFSIVYRPVYPKIDSINSIKDKEG